jgi:hypothetical protein
VQAEWANCDLLGRSFNGHGRPHFSSVVPREKVLWVPRWQSGIVCPLPSLRIFPRVFQTENRVLVGSSGERLSCLSPCRVAQHLRFSRIGSTSPSDASPAFALQMIWKTAGKLPRVSSTETDPRGSRPSLRGVSVNQGRLWVKGGPAYPASTRRISVCNPLYSGHGFPSERALTYVPTPEVNQIHIHRPPKERHVRA